MATKGTKTKSQAKQGATQSKGKSGARAGPKTMGKTTMAKNAGSSSTKEGGLNLTQVDKVLTRFQQQHPRLGKQLIETLQPHGIATNLNPAWR